MAFYLNEKWISWQSQKQQTMTLSSCEAKFIIATETLCQASWLRNLLNEVIRSELKWVTFYVDNKSAIALMKNLVFHGRNIHIDTSFHFIRECVAKRKIVVEFLCTRERRADILTKTLARFKFAEMREFLGGKNLEQTKVYGRDCELVNLT